jgi:hypothetical protein
MHRLSFLPKALFPFIFLFMNCQEGFSQESRPFRYSEDIEIDFAPFLRGEPGISLLYKHGLGKTIDAEQKKRFALRILLGYYRSSYGYSVLLDQLGDTTFLRDGSGDTKDKFLRVGTEFQVHKNNFRWHLGADLGYLYSTSLGESHDLAQVNGMSTITAQYKNEQKSNILEGAILAGVNYFFLPRFSIGLEANIIVGLEYSNAKRIQSGVVISQDNGTVLIIDANLWRLLCLSYHFGKPTPKDLPGK